MREEDEQALRAARARRFRSHIDLAERAAHFGYWSTVLADGSHFWSPGMYRLLDEDPSTLSPNPDWLLAKMPPEEAAAVRRAIADAIRTGSPFSYRTHSTDKTGAIKIVDTQGEVEVDENGRTTVVLGVCHDVTSQVRAEEAREQAQAKYRLMTEESSDIIILYSLDSKMLFCSNALERLVSRTPDEIRDGGYKRFIHPDDTEEAAKMMEPAEDGTTVVATWRILHADGHYIWLENTVRVAYHPETGEPLNIISVSRDITARKTQELAAKAAQERAEMANKAKSEFLANMSHELRTPLNAIIGFTDLMRHGMFGPLGNSRYSEYATMIYDSGQLLLDLISDMLDMAKIEAGKLELNFERVDLAGMIEDAVRLLRDRAETGGVKLSVDAAQALPSILADRRAVKQVLLNLLSNAIKFTPAGGHVRVCAAQDGEYARITVCDDGIGIPASEIQRLGNPFEQVCGDPMLAKSGTGLGLALVRALAKQHGGALQIASTEGIGTEVSVTLPLNRAKRAVA